MEQQRIQQLTEANDIASAAAQKLAEEAAELRLEAQIEANKAAEIRKQQEIQLALIEQLKLAQQSALAGDTVRSAQVVLEQQNSINDDQTVFLNKVDDYMQQEGDQPTIDTDAISAALFDLDLKEVK